MCIHRNGYDSDLDFVNDLDKQATATEEKLAQLKAEGQYPERIALWETFALEDRAIATLMRNASVSGKDLTDTDVTDAIYSSVFAKTQEELRALLTPTLVPETVAA